MRVIEKIRVERDPEVELPEDAPAIRKLRRWMLQGRPATAKSPDFGLGPTAINAVVKDLRSFGYEVAREKDNYGEVIFRVTNPDHEPVEPEPTKKSRPTVSDTSASSSVAGLFGARVQITGLNLDRDQNVLLTLEGADGLAVMCQLTAVVGQASK